MAPITYTLVSLGSQKSQALLDSLKSLPPTSRPLYIGQCHHWIHQPRLSTTALNGTGPEVQKWDYLIITKEETSLTTTLNPHASKTWSITAECADEMLASLSESNTRRANSPAIPLPPGWNAQDHSGLDAAIAPPDLEASLAMTSRPMGTQSTSTPQTLKDFMLAFTKHHTGPVAMFNLLSYLPEQRPRYFQYMAAFQESVGIKYGGEPIVVGLGVKDWSSRKEEDGDWKWEDTALIWYPSLWHFGKMLDDEAYMDVDRKFKQGVLRDNPLMCCTEVKLE